MHQFRAEDRFKATEKHYSKMKKETGHTSEDHACRCNHSEGADHKIQGAWDTPQEKYQAEPDKEEVPAGCRAGPRHK